MIIKFCGAARTVTGSQHLIEIDGKKILLDCGLYQGKREESFKKNRHFLFNPSEIDSVILSHAHIDHSGNLPTLYSKGFRGTIYSTTATRDLCALMLQDSAHIHIRDAEFINKKRKRRNEPLFNPLYTSDDVRQVMGMFKAVSYNKEFVVNGFDDSVKAVFFEAGHILGSSQIVLEIKKGKRKYRIGFTGDLGRPNLPILRDPEFIGNVDTIISESTYGCRVHAKAEEMDEQLTEVLKEAISRGGKIIVPAFSVGRTQELVYSLSKLFSQNVIPRIPIYVDSPLSANVSEVFKIHHECFDKEISFLISSGVDVFGFSNLHYVRDAEESKSLNDIKGSCMIISASGMCEAGRILHHLANSIGNPKSTILIIGYMAQETLGRRLVESKDIKNINVKIFGDEYNVKAKIYVLNSFSAHADRDELTEYFEKFDRKVLKNIFLVHGDIEQSECLKANLKNLGFRNVYIPSEGETAEITF